jgi:hypothetical protein
MIGLTLPEAYVRIIDSERDLMGSSRNHFMAQLVLRKAGLLPLERPKHAPRKYDVTDLWFFLWLPDSDRALLAARFIPSLPSPLPSLPDYVPFPFPFLSTAGSTAAATRWP